MLTENIIKVFFDDKGYPFKDKALTTRFPIVGQAFLGASNTTKIRFYYELLGGNSSTAWVSEAKRPDGQVGSHLLSKDRDENGRYAELSLNTWYTQCKGDLFISLKGFQGDSVTIETDDETNMQVIYGQPVIQATGSIKLAINYAPIGPVANYQDEMITYQNILDELGNKLDETENFEVIEVNHSSQPQVLSDENVAKALKDKCLIKMKWAEGVYHYFYKSNVSGNTITFYAIDSSIDVDDFVYYVSSFAVINTSTKELTFYEQNYDEIGYTEASIDGMFEALDNVVSLDPDAMGTISATDYAKINKFPSYLKRNNRFYIHCTDDNDYLYFREFNLNYLTAEGNSYTYRESYIKVAKSGTHNYSWGTEYTSFYSKNQSNATFGNSIQLSIDSNYDLVVKLLNANGVVIDQDDVDLPLESIIVSATYYATYTYDGTTYTNVLVITLATTDVPTIVPLGDLVSGLVNTSSLIASNQDIQDIIYGEGE